MLGLELKKWPVVGVLSQGPAFAAGLRGGDVVLAFDGQDVAAISSPAEAMTALAGAAGQAVEIKVKRGESVKVFRVVRVSLAVFSVAAQVVGPKTLHVSIGTLEGSGVAKRVGELIPASSRGADWTILLDLRDDGGGRLEEANGVASLFLDGKVLETLAFRDGRRIAFRAGHGNIRARVVVLVNRNTGSSAEVLAMAPARQRPGGDRG